MNEFQPDMNISHFRVYLAKICIYKESYNDA